MKRGESYGGGQSSLGYLFGSDDKQKNNAPLSSPTACTPPYGIDIDEKPQESPPPKEQKPESPPPKEQKGDSNNYKRIQGQNSGNFITGRPSTKVNSVPGGDSSLGYLFGDKS